MTTFFVIRSVRGDTYLSAEGEWDDFFRCAEFDSEESALKVAGRLLGYFIIEKVYHT